MACATFDSVLLTRLYIWPRDRFHNWCTAHAAEETVVCAPQDGGQPGHSRIQGKMQGQGAAGPAEGRKSRRRQVRILNSLPSLASMLFRSPVRTYLPPLASNRQSTGGKMEVWFQRVNTCSRFFILLSESTPALVSIVQSSTGDSADT